MIRSGEREAEMKKISGIAEYKASGTLGDFISILIAIFVSIIIMITAIGFSGDSQRKIKIDDLARTTILRMDDTGYLTPEMKSDLTASLTALGCRNISYAGSTVTPADYGSPVYLKVTFDMPASDFMMDTDNMFTFRQTTRYISTGIYEESRSRNG